MKKFVCMALSLAIFSGSLQMAYANEMDSADESFLVEIHMSLEEKEEVFGDVDNLENSIVYIVEDVEEAKRVYHIQTDKENMQRINQGLEKIDEKIYVLEESSDVSGYDVSNPETKIVINETSWNKPSEVLNDKSKGMKFWLDVPFNLLIGSYTKHAWQAATILGLNPSNFLPDWQKGDLLEKEESMISRDKWVQVKETDGYINAGRARREDITVYLDLRTSTKVNGQLESFKKSGSEKFVNITKNYNNHSVLESKTLSEAVLDGHVVSFYEDPWDF